MSKEILYGKEARNKMLIGINKLGDAVKTTIGPKGLNAVLARNYGSNVITNDGVSIAKEIELEDKFENLGASLIKEVAEKTNDEVGDGTSTSIVLSQALIGQGIKLINTDVNAVGLRRGMMIARMKVIEELKKHARQIKTEKEIAQAASVSAESDNIGKMIAKVMTDIGLDGVLTVETTKSIGIEAEIVKGFSFDRGFVSPTDDLKTETLGAKILITDKKIHSLKQIDNVIALTLNEGFENLIVIADNFDDRMLYDCEMAKLQGGINIVSVLAPDFAKNKKNTLKDIAICMGGKFISSNETLEEVKLKDLGQCDKALFTRATTTLIGGAGKKSDVANRVDEVKKLIKECNVLSDKETIKKRLSRISGGVGVIKVGASTETETVYLKHKIEDAICATKAAMEEGVVIGAGCALVKVSHALKGKEKGLSREEQFGFKLVLDAIQSPLKQIVTNGGDNYAEVVLDKVISGSKEMGYNTKEAKYEEDMFKIGIVDPVKVTRIALENAVSIAALILTTETAIVDNTSLKTAL